MNTVKESVMQSLTKARLLRWGIILVLTCMFAVIGSVTVAAIIVNDPAILPLGAALTLFTGCLLVVFPRATADLR